MGACTSNAARRTGRRRYKCMDPRADVSVQCARAGAYWYKHTVYSGARRGPSDALCAVPARPARGPTKDGQSRMESLNQQRLEIV